MKRSGILLLVLALNLILSLPAHAVEVEVEGEAAIFSGNVASAKKQALTNAQRNAVEKGLGLILDSSTIMRNYQIIKDDVLTSTQGFVKSYKILSEGRGRGGQSYRVKIRADVSKNLLENRLSALRILHKKMGNKRVMVVYQPVNPNAMKRDHGATQAALRTLRDQLNRSGFRVFNPEATEKIYSLIDQAGNSQKVENLIALSLDQQADVLVRFELTAGRERGDLKGMALFSNKATIRVSVFDTTTGRQIADSEADAKQISRGGDFDKWKGLSEASAVAAKNVSDEVIGKIADYYKQVGDEGIAYLIVFKGFNDDAKDQIIDFLENTPGMKQLSELKNTTKFLEVELFSSQDVSRLRRIIRAGLKEKGIQLQILTASRNRIVFANPNQQ